MHSPRVTSMTEPQRLWFAVVVTILTLLMLTATSACVQTPKATSMPTTEEWGVARLSIMVDGEEDGYCTVWKTTDGMAITAGHCCMSVEEAIAEREEQRQFEQLLEFLMSDDEEMQDEELPPLPPPVITYVAHGNMAFKDVKFKVLRDDDENDVCVLKGELKGKPITIAAHDPKVGEKVWTEGYPKGVFLITEGYWSGMRSPSTMVASTGIWGGASGSPVMNAKGEAVGLLVRYMPPMSNMTLMTPIEWLVANITNAKRVLADQ